MSGAYCLLLPFCNSALFKRSGKPAAVNSSLTAEVDEFHMWLRVQLANIQGIPAWNRRAGGRGTAHEQVSLHMLSTAAVGRISRGPDIQHNHRSKQPEQSDAECDCSREQLKPVVHSSGFEQQL